MDCSTFEPVITALILYLSVVQICQKCPNLHNLAPRSPIGAPFGEEAFLGATVP